MRITVNGTPVELPDGTSVRALIERQGLAKSACAAEVNKALVPRRSQDTHVLRDGDMVELVALVGGG